MAFAMLCQMLFCLKATWPHLAVVAPTKAKDLLETPKLWTSISCSIFTIANHNGWRPHIKSPYMDTT